MILRSEILRLKSAKQFARAPYSFPGGYPKALITADGDCLCADCTRANYKLICAESFENSNCGFRVSGVDVNYENPDLYCGNCSTRIPSAYAESDIDECEAESVS